MAKYKKIESNRWPDVGDVFAIPLSDGRWGACRVLNRYDDEDPTGFLRGPCFFIAVSPWVGSKLPDIEEPQLCEVLVRDHHSWEADTQLGCTQYPPPFYFPHVGVLPPTPEEMEMRERKYSGWHDLAEQILPQWRWDNEREEVLREDEEGPNSVETAKQNMANWERKAADLAKKKPAHLLSHNPMEGWEGRVPEGAVKDLHKELEKMVAAMEVFAPDADKRERIKPIRAFNNRIDKIDRKHDWAICWPELEELHDMLRDAAIFMGFHFNSAEIRRVLVRGLSNWRPQITTKDEVA